MKMTSAFGIRAGTVAKTIIDILIVLIIVGTFCNFYLAVCEWFDSQQGFITHAKSLEHITNQ
jgi:hypothetical protein